MDRRRQFCRTIRSLLARENSSNLNTTTLGRQVEMHTGTEGLRIAIMELDLHSPATVDMWVEVDGIPMLMTDGDIRPHKGDMDPLLATICPDIPCLDAHPRTGKCDLRMYTIKGRTRMECIWALDEICQRESWVGNLHGEIQRAGTVDPDSL